MGNSGGQWGAGEGAEVRRGWVGKEEGLECQNRSLGFVVKAAGNHESFKVGEKSVSDSC